MNQSGFADRVRNDRFVRLGTDVQASDLPDDEKLTDLDRSVNTGMVQFNQFAQAPLTP